MFGVVVAELGRGKVAEVKEMRGLLKKEKEGK